MPVKVTVSGPESVFSDAAQPLLKICDELSAYERVQENVEKARALILEAAQILDEAFSSLR